MSRAFDLKNILNFKGFKRGLGRVLRSKEGGEEPRAEGRLYTAWLWALPVLLGTTLGWFAMTSLGVLLEGLRPSESGAFAPVGLDTIRDKEREAGLGAFIATNPFRVSPMPELVAPETRKAAVVTGSLAQAVLRGTLPGVGAWLEDRGRDRLVLVGTSFDVYTLEKVTGHRATFVKSADRVVKELLYSGPSSPAMSNSSPSASPLALPTGNVVPAAPDGKPGELPSGLVSQLVENPFEELKRVRLRPSEEGTGLAIEWIQDDSILSQLGVKKGDVVKSINGIPFRNMADIANSINSLMNSERFDVEVTRDGQPTSLQYVVR